MPVLEKTVKSGARLNFRLPAEIKERIEDAAIVSGVTVTDFAINALASTADEVLEKQRVRKLSARDSKIFLDMLENPPEPNEAFLKAAEEYRRRIKRGPPIFG